MNLCRKRFGKDIKSLLAKKRRKKKMKQSSEVEMKDVMHRVEKDSEILGTQDVPDSMVHLELPKEDKKMKGILVSCCKQEDLPKYDLSNSKHAYGGPSSTSCDVCMDVFSIRDLICAPNCKHRFCKDCIETYLLKEIQEDATNVTCPEPKCKDVLKLGFCRKLIPEQVFDRWESEVNLASSFERREIVCPYFECRKEFMDDGKGYTIRACPHCWNLICMSCGLVEWQPVEWHIGKDCKTFRRERMFSSYYQRSYDSHYENMYRRVHERYGHYHFE